MEVEQHLLLKFVFTIADINGIVVPIEVVNEGLDRGFVQVSEVRSGLTRFLPQHHQLRVDEAEGVNHNFPLDTLDRVHNDRYGSFVQSFETL